MPLDDVVHCDEHLRGTPLSCTVKSARRLHLRPPWRTGLRLIRRLWREAAASSSRTAHLCTPLAQCGEVVVVVPHEVQLPYRRQRLRRRGHLAGASDGKGAAFKRTCTRRERLRTCLAGISDGRLASPKRCAPTPTAPEVTTTTRCPAVCITATVSHSRAMADRFTVPVSCRVRLEVPT